MPFRMASPCSDINEEIKKVMALDPSSRHLELRPLMTDEEKAKAKQDALDILEEKCLNEPACILIRGRCRAETSIALHKPVPRTARITPVSIALKGEREKLMGKWGEERARILREEANLAETRRMFDAGRQRELTRLEEEARRKSLREFRKHPERF